MRFIFILLGEVKFLESVSQSTYYPVAIVFWSEQSSMDSSKGIGKANDEGGEEIIKVETVDHRTPVGREAEPEKKTVEVTHVIHEGEKPGVVAGAVGKVAGAVQSAKEAVSGDKKNE